MLVQTSNDSFMARIILHFCSFRNQLVSCQDIRDDILQPARCTQNIESLGNISSELSAQEADGTSWRIPSLKERKTIEVLVREF